MEQDGINQREDGRVDTDAKREREKHGNGEPRRLAKLAKCISHILQQNFHRLTSTDIALRTQKAYHGSCATGVKSIGWRSRDRKPARTNERVCLKSDAFAGGICRLRNSDGQALRRNKIA